MAFAEFCARSGQVVICGDDPGARGAVSLAGVPAISYGTAAEADVRLTIATPGPGGARGSLLVEGVEVPVALPIDGAHNLLDAAAAVAVSSSWGSLPPTPLARSHPSPACIAASRNGGGSRGPAYDYAHVPTELSVTLAVARARRPGRLVAVFQPHRYSRTQALWRELGAALTEADLVVVTDVYGANGTDPRGDGSPRGRRGARAAPTARWCTPRTEGRDRVAHPGGS